MYAHGGTSEDRGTRPASDEAIVGTVKLEARKGAELSVGMYEDGLAPPTFCVQTEPQAVPHDIEVSLMRINHPGEYELRYYFQNFTDRDFRVTVQEKET